MSWIVPTYRQIYLTIFKNFTVAKEAIIAIIYLVTMILKSRTNNRYTLSSYIGIQVNAIVLLQISNPFQTLFLSLYFFVENFIHLI